MNKNLNDKQNSKFWQWDIIQSQNLQNLVDYFQIKQKLQLPFLDITKFNIKGINRMLN